MSAFPIFVIDAEDDDLRDVSGRLIHAEEATLDELTRWVKVRVDGQLIDVLQATPWIDDQGLVRTDSDGTPIPRRTTLYDAIVKRYSPGREVDPAPTTDDVVPVLCHQEHLAPVAVCRVCSVLLAPGGKPNPRLVPACKHPVWADRWSQTPENIPEVHTSWSQEVVRIADREPERAGTYVARAVRQVVELIALDHLHDKPGEDRPYENELLAVSQRMAPPSWRDPKAPVGRDLVSRLPKVPAADARRVDVSSSVIRFDRASCILCDRCARSCHDVKPFGVISHTHRGHETAISFDLDKPMGKSSCVSCGECAISCPTGALSFRGTVYQDRDPWADQVRKPVTIKARDLRAHSLFADVPLAFLKWNEGAAGRLELSDGEVLCQLGEFGATAFVIERGTLAVDRGPGKTEIERTAEDVIVGEMACMNNRARNATIRAKGPASVLVIRRNLLHMLRRNRVARNILERAYSSRVLENWNASGGIFAEFPGEERRRHVEFLRSRPKGDVRYVRVDPRQTILREGEVADCVYFLLDGHVEVSEATPSGGKRVRDYLGPGRSFGEIGVLSELSDAIAAQLDGRRGIRSGTCTALDHVELIRVSKEALLAMLDSGQFPTLRTELERQCLELIRKNKNIPDAHRTAFRNDFTRLGLHQGQNLLVIDLEKCTRCLECVQACSDSHGGDTRLIFEWERFGKYLVPAACRSCHDPLCLVGCPVDAIHRRPSHGGTSDRPALAVVIEDHCIGCGLCAHNCPFDSIQMHDLRRGEGTRASQAGSAARIAKNCDMCESGKLGGVPRCVYACPHDAAKRAPGHALMSLLELDMLGPFPPG